MGSIVIFRISSCPPLFVVYQYHTCNWFYFSYFLLYYGAYGIVYPGSISIAGSIGTPWISAGTSVAALGQGTDWQFNFQWTTAGGGGGRYGHFGNAEVSVDKAIANAQSYYYNYQSHSQGSSLDPMVVLSTTLSLSLIHI